MSEAPRFPRFPLHIGDWLSDPRTRRLERADRDRLLELLLAWWMEQAVPERPAEVPDPVWAEFCRVLPDYQRHRLDLEARYSSNVAKTTAARAARAAARAARAALRAAPTEPPTEAVTTSVTENVTTRSPSPSPSPPTEVLPPSEVVPPAEALRGERGAPATWLTPYIDAWVRIRGGKPSRTTIGKMAASLAAPRREHGDAILGRGWCRWLAETRLERPEPTFFVESLGQWIGTQRRAPHPGSQESLLADFLRDAGRAPPDGGERPC